MIAPLQDAARYELARRRLLDFAKLIYPNFAAPPHVRLIADLLEQAERKEKRRITISVPVRHGKSVISSQLFAAWYVGRNPQKNVILASHSEDLAVRNSRIARSFLQDKRWPFPDVRLATDSQSAARWNTTAGGGVFAIGVGGGITGRGADMLIIDDALHDGLSAAECASAWSWYSEVAVPRLEPGGTVIVIGARFGTTDLIGTILESDDGPNWHVVNLSAIAEEGDPLGRQPGEALWPERMDLDELEMRRSMMSSHAFEAQFLQRPTPRGGNLLKIEWLSHRYSGSVPQNRRAVTTGAGPYTTTTEEIDQIHTVMGCDIAAKTGIANDYSAIVTIKSNERDIFVVDVVRERLEFPALLRRIKEQAEKHKPSRLYVEEASSGFATVQELKYSSGLPVIGVPPRGSKTSRVEALTGLFESGRVKLPEHAPWLDAFIAELLSFPSGKNDDQLDALVLAISMLSALIVDARQWRRSDPIMRNFTAR